MNKKNLLIFGDIITFAIVTLIGFISHGESDTSYLPRFFAALIPLFISWFILIPWFGLLNQELIKQAKNLLLIPLVMIFVIPLATIIRGFILNSPVLPSFVLALYATNTLGMLIWRAFYIFVANKIK